MVELLSPKRIISVKQLELLETIGQGIHNNCIYIIQYVMVIIR